MRGGSRRFVTMSDLCTKGARAEVKGKMKMGDCAWGRRMAEWVERRLARRMVEARGGGGGPFGALSRPKLGTVCIAHPLTRGPWAIAASNRRSRGRYRRGLVWRVDITSLGGASPVGLARVVAASARLALHCQNWAKYLQTDIRVSPFRGVYHREVRGSCCGVIEAVREGPVSCPGVGRGHIVARCRIVTGLTSTGVEI